MKVLSKTLKCSYQRPRLSKTVNYKSRGECGVVFPVDYLAPLGALKSPGH